MKARTDGRAGAVAFQARALDLSPVGPAEMEARERDVIATG